MYFKSIKIENTGPIDNLNIEFDFAGDRPKPTVVVGPNGAGKSILLAHLVNVLAIGRGQVFEDNDIEKGMVYKYRSPKYIKSGKNHAYSRITFGDNSFSEEIQLNFKKNIFQEQAQYLPQYEIWNSVPPEETSAINTTFKGNNALTERLFKKQCCLYFPVNRFEEPAWLNLDNLRGSAVYTTLKKVSGYSNRSFINTSPLKNNKNWILDLLLDRSIGELVKTPGKLQNGETIEIYRGYAGQASSIYVAAIQILMIILRNNASGIRFGVNTRNSRSIAVMRDNNVWIPDVFQLSTGEVQLLNLFLCIVRDFDLCETNFSSLAEIRGIVIVDEIDCHLHTDHQREVLPELIGLFPNVQFIITSHSPLFLLGMQAKFGDNGFSIFNMPDGRPSTATDFSEFTAAYNSFKETQHHKKEIIDAIAASSRLKVFVEGAYDIKYIQKAAELMGKTKVLERVQLLDGNGFGNLDKVWRVMDTCYSYSLSEKILLMYDCDTNKQNTVRGKVTKSVIPTIATSPITKGIENLFPETTIAKAEQASSAFIDTYGEITKRIRGVLVPCPPEKFVNKDEKGNLCDWIVANGNLDDFQNFKSIFNIIESELAT